MVVLFVLWCQLELLQSCIILACVAYELLVSLCTERRSTVFLIRLVAYCKYSEKS